jgi:hypothetical protein
MCLQQSRKESSAAVLGLCPKGTKSKDAPRRAARMERIENSKNEKISKSVHHFGLDNRLIQLQYAGT